MFKCRRGWFSSLLRLNVSIKQ